MTLHDMIDIIETSSKENAYALIEAETNAVSRLKLRILFFQALMELKETWPCNDRPSWPDEFLQWEE